MYKFILALLLFAATGCRQKGQQVAVTASTADTTSFPFTDILQSDIQDVQEHPYLIYRLNTVGDKKDSTVLTKQQFFDRAGLMLAKDIFTPHLKPLYKESAFHDLTTKSYTIVYTATDKTLAVQDVTILLNDATNITKDIIVHSVTGNADSSVTEWNDWKKGKSFHTSRTITVKDGSSTQQSDFINWKALQ